MNYLLLKSSKIKGEKENWDASQEALFFNAFLARHDDDNDAHIKDKD